MAIRAGVPFRALVYAQVISGLCQIGAGLYGIGTEPQGGEEEVRYAGLAGNANELGLQLTLGACLIWFLPKKAGAAACALALAAVAYAICTTGSRKAFLMMPVFLLLVVIQMAAYIKKHRAIFAIAGIVGLGLAGIVLTPTILESAKDITAISRTLDPYDSSFDKRSGMAHQAVRLWHEAPLFGNGTDAFRRLSGYGTYAHNNYAELLCDLGVVGTMLFYAIHLYILFMCFRLPLPLAVYCCVFVILLLALDIGYVSYYRKQTIMILMVLASIVTSCHQIRQTAKGFSTGRMSTARPVGRPKFAKLAVRD
jgi:O-antigen ligase